MARSKKSSGVSGVRFVREEVNLLLPSYFLIRDVIEGELAVKGILGNASGVVTNNPPTFNFTNDVLTRAKRYLPQPNAEDQSEANRERYRAYLTRAVFYGVTGRTLEGLAGQIFLRDPVVKVPAELDVLKDDSDGGGVSLDQLAHRAVRHCIAYGRSGVFVDYPATNGVPATKQNILSGAIHPILIVYNPWDIISWRIAVKGSKRYLTRVVVREMVDVDGDDGFSVTTEEQFRVLQLDPKSGEYVVEVHTKDETGQGFTPKSTFNPKDAKGKALTEIPFHFIGSETNDFIPNRPPMYDLASLNIAHYRNSADYEESSFIVGQPTPVLSGLTQDWVETVLGGKVQLGSRASIALPANATATLLQALPNSMPMEAMKQKEAQMIALGAKLVQSDHPTTSATEQIIETTSESSVLANVAKNVSSTFVWALKIAASFVGGAAAAIEYTLNKDFDITSMTADDQNALIKQWQAGAIGFPEMRSGLRKAGIATMDDDAARAQIKQDIKDGLIPDPTLQNVQPAVPDAKEKSGAGGPQPQQRHRPSKP